MATTKQIDFKITANDTASAVFDKLNTTLDKVSSQASATTTAMMAFGGAVVAIEAVQAALAGLEKAWGLAELGAEAQQAEETFAQVTESVGISGDELIAKLKEVSNATIDDSDIMQEAIAGITAGLSFDTIVALMETARVSSRLTGDTVAEAYTQILTAVESLQTRGLKSASIIIEQDDAYAAYATTLGKVSGELTTQEKKQALANAVIAEGIVQAEAMGGVSENNTEVFQQLDTILKGLEESLGKALVPAMAELAGEIKEMAEDGRLNTIIETLTALGEIALKLTTWVIDFGAKWNATFQSVGERLYTLYDALKSGDFSVFFSTLATNVKWGGDEITKTAESVETDFDKMVAASDKTAAKFDTDFQAIGAAASATKQELTNSYGFYQAFYSSLEDLYKQSIAKMKALGDERVANEKETQDALAALTAPLDEATVIDYYATVSDLQGRYMAALNQDSATQLAQMQDIKASWIELGQAVTADYEAGLISASEYQSAVTTLSNGINTSSDAIDKNLGSQQDSWQETGQAAVSQMDALQPKLNDIYTQLKAIDDKVKEPKFMEISTTEALASITDLSTQINTNLLSASTTTKAVTMETDQALTDIGGVQGALNAIPDTTTKTIKIVTEYSTSSSSSGGMSFSESADRVAGYAAGTNYVPKTGLYQLHEGESVITRSQTVNNLSTSSASPTFNLTISGSSITDAKTLDAELAKLWKGNRSQLRAAMA